MWCDKKALSAIFLSLIYFTLYPQDSIKNDSIQAEEFFTKANEYYYEIKNYSKASQFYGEALSFFSTSSDIDHVALCYLRLGNCAYFLNNYDEALENYQQVINVFHEVGIDSPKLGSAYNNIGSVYSIIGKNYLAKQNMEKGLEIRIKALDANDPDLAISYANLANIYSEFGEYKKAMNFSLKSLAIIINLHGEQSPEAANLYVNLGILYDKKGEYARAVEYYLKSNEININLHGENYRLLAYNFTNLAISYKNLNKVSLSQEFFNKAIELAKVNDLFEIEANGYYELGELLFNDQQYQEAIKLAIKAEEIITSHYPPGYFRLNFFHRLMAKSYQGLKNYDLAMDHYQLAYDNVVQNFGEKHPHCGRIQSLMSAMFLEQKNFTSALSCIHGGLAAICRVENYSNEFSVPFESISSHESFLDLITAKADIQIALYRNQNTQARQLQLLIDALRQYKLAGKFIDHIRRGYIAESSKIFLQNNTTTLNEKAISLCYELYFKTNDDSYLHEALNFNEKNKATVLNESMQAADISSLKNIPDSVLYYEKSLKESITAVENSLRSAQDNHGNTQIIKKLKQEIFATKRSYDSLVQVIETKYPAYYDLKYNFDDLEIKKIQQNLDPATAIISYFTGTENLFVFLITSESIKVLKKSINQYTKKNINEFCLNIKNRNIPITKIAVQSLDIFQFLLEEALFNLEGKENLIIIPDGILHYLPFESLITEMNEANFNMGRFLIEDYTVSYANAISLWLINKNMNQREIFNSPYVGFAPTYHRDKVSDHKFPLNNISDLAKLNGNTKEVEFAKAYFKGKAYINEEASEYRFKSLTNKYAIIHLAMHAQINDEDPMSSRLIFTDQNDSLEDGFLNAYEIYNLKLQTELAVLSACNTGRGEFHKGEGLISLSRAFTYAGCPNIVTSLWNALDQPTSQIMQSFFRNLGNKMPKDRALRKAKLDYIKSADPLSVHPANWATFILIGDSDPVNFSFKLPHYWKGIIILLVIMTIMFLVRKIF